MFSIHKQSDFVDVDIDRLVLVVVGVQPLAERWDRPLAYRLCQQLMDWQDTFFDKTIVEPIVISDVWYLNHRAYETRPAVAVGSPRHNALTAMLTERLPVVHAVDEQLLVQIDDSADAMRCCLWGSGPGQTERALDAFLEQFLDDWMNRIADVCDGY